MLDPEYRAVLKSILLTICRRVMAEQRALERKAQLVAKEDEEREQDARLETLRKSTRRRLGIGVARPSGEKHTTALLPTVASTAKIREKVTLP